MMRVFPGSPEALFSLARVKTNRVKQTMLESTDNVEAQRSGIVSRPTDSEPRPGHRRLSVCIINPRSQPSYWTFDFATPFFNLGRGRQYSMANGPLLAVAALVPAEHEVVILDENIEEIDFE